MPISHGTACSDVVGRRRSPTVRRSQLVRGGALVVGGTASAATGAEIGAFHGSGSPGIVAGGVVAGGATNAGGVTAGRGVTNGPGTGRPTDVTDGRGGASGAALLAAAGVAGRPWSGG
jgi:hypothetical protein